MLLKDANARFTALKLLRDVVDAAMKDEKADHLQALIESAEATDSTKWSVKIDGTEVASISLVQKSDSIVIADPAKLANHLAPTSPEYVQLGLRDWAKKEFESLVAHVDDEGNGFTEDGELIGPGVVTRPAGTPYQSVRWNSKNNGKEVLGEAIRSGDLQELLAGVPLIES